MTAARTAEVLLEYCAGGPVQAPAAREHKVSEHYQTYWISRRIFWVQGLYFTVTGVWPLLHLPSFEWVTGVKQDHWLVQTVGAIVTVIGVSLCLSGRARVLNMANYALAVGSAFALMVVDVVFTANRTISPIYLLDGAGELFLLIAWATLGLLALRENRVPDRKYFHHLALALR